MANRKRLSLQSFKKMSQDDIKGLSRKEAQNILREARNLYYKRAATLEKYVGKGNFYSPAYENPGFQSKKGDKRGMGIKTWYEERESQGKISAPSKTKIADAKAELSRLNQFFNSQSSTVKGTQEIARKQDIRIFGPSESNPNIPAKRMTREERIKFWSVYNEYATSDAYEARFYLRYRDIQEELGNVILSKRGKDGGIGGVEIGKLLDELDRKLQGEYYEYDQLSELSGSGDDFSY